MIHNLHKHDEVVRTLHYIQRSGFRSAVIAGGAVRDIYFEKMPADIDIFLWDPSYSNENTVAEAPESIDFLAQMFNIKPVGPYNPRSVADDHIERVFGEYPEGGVTRVTAVWNVMKNFLPLQIIFVSERPDVYVDQYFDFGICKAYCDGIKLRYTRDFMHDAHHKKLSYVAKEPRDFETKFSLENHLPKLQSKFPDHKFFIAPWNKELVEKVTKK